MKCAQFLRPNSIYKFGVTISSGKAPYTVVFYSNDIPVKTVSNTYEFYHEYSFTTGNTGEVSPKLEVRITDSCQYGYVEFYDVCYPVYLVPVGQGCSITSATVSILNMDNSLYSSVCDIDIQKGSQKKIKVAFTGVTPYDYTIDINGNTILSDTNFYGDSISVDHIFDYPLSSTNTISVNGTDYCTGDSEPIYSTCKFTIVNTPPPPIFTCTFAIS